MAQQAKTFPPPVDWDELYPGRFIKACDFKGKKPTLEISAVRIEELHGDKGLKIKGVISFRGKDKQWALNKTNGICLREMFGKKVQEWVGHKVTLFAAPYEGDEAIRVWGSPELPADREVSIQLPRKRPFNMILHAVPGPKPVGGNPSAPPPTDDEPPLGSDDDIP